MKPKPEWHKLVEENTGLCWEMVNRYCSSYSREDKEDVAAECMIALMKAAQSYDTKHATEQGTSVRFSTYACVLIRHCITNVWRMTRAKCRGGGKVETLQMDTHEDGFEPAYTDSRVEQIDVADACEFLLGNTELDAKHKEVLVKRFYEYQLPKQIATESGVTRVSVSNRLAKAIRRLGKTATKMA